jgi:hypothetical protein
MNYCNCIRCRDGSHTQTAGQENTIIRHSVKKFPQGEDAVPPAEKQGKIIGGLTVGDCLAHFVKAVVSLQPEALQCLFKASRRSFIRNAVYPLNSGLSRQYAGTAFQFAGQDGESAFRTVRVVLLRHRRCRHLSGQGRATVRQRCTGAGKQYSDKQHYSKQPSFHLASILNRGTKVRFFQIKTGVVFKKGYISNCPARDLASATISVDSAISC